VVVVQIVVQTVVQAEKEGPMVQKIRRAVGAC